MSPELACDRVGIKNVPFGEIIMFVYDESEVPIQRVPVLPQKDPAKRPDRADLESAIGEVWKLMPNSKSKNIVTAARRDHPGQFRTDADVIVTALDFFAAKWKP